MLRPLQRVTTLSVSANAAEAGSRIVPEETPVALVYDGSTHAVMMATPADLEDFALGFSLAEGKIASPDEVREIDVVAQENGVEVRIWLTPGAGRRTAARRRALLGPTGCGLCGVESLAEALPPLPYVDHGTMFEASDIAEAVAALATEQTLNRDARAMHAAAFWSPGQGLVAVREDVGRHNALDKLGGALASMACDSGTGILVLTSRVSVEMVQKAAMFGAGVVAAVSAPTALAIRSATAAGITLAAVVRGDTFEIFSHPHRIKVAASASECRFREEPTVHAAF